MTIKLASGLLVGTSLAFALPAFAQSNQPIQIAGSSTVLPYAQIVAENFGETFPNYPTPVVESGGSSAGLKQFCQGVGPDTIDIADSSREIRPSEIEACKTAGVSDISQVKFGYDGIVFASSASGPSFKLTPEEIYKAMAAKVPQDGSMKDKNPYTNWSQIDSSLPDQEISAFIPASNHGTREVFEEKVLLAGCEASGAKKMMMQNGMDEKAAKEACVNVRNDSRIGEISGDYTETLARIEADPKSVGVFGLSFYEQNQDKLKVATVNGVTPSAKTVASGEYPVSRPLFFYVKRAHLGVVPGLSDYVKFFLSEQMTGEGSPTVEYGLVPLSQEERAQQLKQFESGKTVSASDSKGSASAG